MPGKPQDNPELWFALFASLGGTRSVRMLWEYGTKLRIDTPSERTLERWSAKYDWQSRARGKDAIDAAARAASLSDIMVDMNKLHLMLNDMRFELIRVALQGAIDKGEPVSVALASQMLDDAAKLQRLIMGAATERREIAHGWADFVAPEIVKLFISVNMVMDATERAEQFLRGMDDIALVFLRQVA